MIFADYSNAMAVSSITEEKDKLSVLNDAVTLALRRCIILSLAFSLKDPKLFSVSK